MTGNVLLPGCRERAWEPGEGYERRASGLWVPAEETPEPRPLGVGLFCGAGGFDLGFTQAGFHMVAASDGWAIAACTYLLNLGAPDTLVHCIGELPEGRKHEHAWHAEHRGGTVTAGQFFEACRGPGDPLAGAREALARRASDHRTDVVAGAVEVVEDPLAGQRADVAEVEALLPEAWAAQLPAQPVWRVTATPDVMIRLKRIFPRAEKSRTGSIALIGTNEVARDLLWVCQRWSFEISDTDRTRLETGAREHEQTEATVHDILTGTRTLEGLAEPARPARHYQQVAADLALTTGRLLLADELGLGKSMTGLLLLRAPEALPALVVCPTHLPRQWVGELAATFPGLRPHVVRTLAPYDPAEKREMGGHDPDVLVINYAKLRGWGDHLAGKVRTVIFDEAQELRRADSDKWKAAARIADEAYYVMGLTATPVYNYGGEVHNIMRVLAPDALGSREEFAREWGLGYWSDKIAVRDPAALGTYLRDQGLMLRRTRTEVGRELPEVVRVPHSIDSDEDTLERLTGDAVDLAELIVAQGTDRRELWKASGDFDWRMRHATGVAKAPYVADFVRMLLETDEPVVLFGWHRDVYDIWGQRLDDHNPVLYTGSESPAAKQRAKDAFLAGETNLFIMSLRAGAGLDGLQERAHIAVFGELDWSPGMHDQCIGRLHRDGQDDPVVAYFLVSDEGADPVIADVLNLKRQQADPIVDPDAELFEEAPSNHDRVRRLAEDVLAKRAGAGRAAA